ncbi:MAG: GntR family transcriptional regulator [Oscillospiraceae bacterium]|nr:GntR family transcriptional regulator [Oscillospiraceae bacterium]
MFSVNYKDPRPIYEQIKDSLRRAILTGVLATDDRIPSVRETASSLAVNPNTIQKAYRELEGEGYIYSVAGRGSFVADFSKAKDARREQLFLALDSTVTELRQAGVADEEIVCRIAGQENEGGYNK